jgi:L-asparaginase II
MQVVQLRGGLVELRHPVSFAVVDAAGRLVRGHDPDHATPWRSAAKPFQLWTALAAMEAAGASENTATSPRSLSDADLAIGAASHSGEPRHTARVEGLLDRFQLGAGALRCGAKRPAHAPTAEALIAAGRPPTALHNDCSGKHAMLLGACQARRWSVDGYLLPDHPLQERILRDVRRFTADRCPTATDGCGVPTFWLPVRAMARAWAQLAAAVADPDLDPSLGRIGQAMQDHPELTSGEGRIDLAVAQRMTGPWIGKIGALGVFCFALPGLGLGGALKVHSGDEGALAAAVPRLVEAVAPGLVRPEAWPWDEVLNVLGSPVGRRLVTGLPRV